MSLTKDRVTGLTDRNEIAKIIISAVNSLSEKLPKHKMVEQLKMQTDFWQLKESYLRAAISNTNRLVKMVKNIDIVEREIIEMNNEIDNKLNLKFFGNTMNGDKIYKDANNESMYVMLDNKSLYTYNDLYEEAGFPVEKPYNIINSTTTPTTSEVLSKSIELNPETYLLMLQKTISSYDSIFTEDAAFIFSKLYEHYNKDSTSNEWKETFIEWSSDKVSTLALRELCDDIGYTYSGVENHNLINSLDTVGMHAKTSLAENILSSDKLDNTEVDTEKSLKTERNQGKNLIDDFIKEAELDAEQDNGLKI